MLALFAIIMSGLIATVNAQTPIKSKTDSVSVNKQNSKEEANRNVMLNAVSTNSPRDINLGIPSTVGGITILENDLPAVYYYWPELTYKTWRASNSLSKQGVLKVSELNNKVGDLGYAVNSYTRLGEDQLKFVGTFATNQYGLIKNDMSLSGPFCKKAKLYYTAGVYINFDPYTYNLKYTDYSDRTQIYRLGITKRYDNGEISLLYKYASCASLSMSGAPFYYKEGGGVKPFEGFDIGRDSYILSTGKIRLLNSKTGEYYWQNLGSNDISNVSNTIDLMGNHKLSSGWLLKYIVRYHNAKAASYVPVNLGLAQATGASGFTTMDDGKPYTGYVQTCMNMFMQKTPVNTVQSRISMSKKTASHDWNFGILNSYYNVDKYMQDRSFYYQTVSANPRQLKKSTTDEYGFFNYNVGAEYHNGIEDKLCAYVSDDWETFNKKLLVSYGLNLQYQKMNGDFITDARTPNIVLANHPTTSFSYNWFHKNANLKLVYRIAPKFGLTLEGVYNESHGRLENFSGATTPNFPLTKSPMGIVGVYYNENWISLVSAVSYLTRNAYQARLNLVNPSNPSDAAVASVIYDIQTVGWTTDAVIKPFKGAQLHYLLTIQNPVYKNYNFSAFGNKYSYDGKNVVEISKVLMEIDPSYTIDKLRLWASLRYYSKQFANLTNALYFQPHWETFAGASYKCNKNVELGLSITNLFNQTGAKGTISGAELITDPTPYYNQPRVGAYIIPFTTQFSVTLNF
jgi:hypothetical protein